jgi:hypothetical protein
MGKRAKERKINFTYKIRKIKNIRIKNIDARRNNKDV